MSFSPNPVIGWYWEQPLHPVANEKQAIELDNGSTGKQLSVPKGARGCIISVQGDPSNTDANKAVAWNYFEVSDIPTGGYEGHPLGDGQYLQLQTVEQMENLWLVEYESGKTANVVYVTYYF